MIPRKRIRRTETVKDPVTQPNLLFDKQKETKEVKKTALDIMMDLQYTRIPNIYKRNPNCKSYFVYKGTIFRKESVTPEGMWIGKNVSGLSNTKKCEADPEECVRLNKQDDLVDLYDFITDFKSFQDDKSTFWCLNIVLFKLENTLRNEYYS